MNARGRLMIGWALSTLFSFSNASASTFIVNDTSDRVDANPGDGICSTSIGSCSLRAAIQEANANAGADTIHIPAGTYRLAIDSGIADPVEPPEPPVEVPLPECSTVDAGAQDGDLDITCSVTIMGAGAGATVITGGSAPFGSPPERTALDRIFEVHPTAASVSISGLTITGGWSENEGGALWNGSTGTLRLTEVRVADSVSTAYGGGIFSSGDLVLERSTISGNSTGGKGGGIFVDGASVTVTGTAADPVVFSGNVAASGGGIFCGGELSLLGLPSKVIVSHASFTGNTAESGGGIHVDQRGELNVNDALFSANHAGDHGGAIAVIQKALATLTRVTVSGNTSSGEGGGGFMDTERSIVVVDSVFSGNRAGVPVVEEDGTIELSDAGGGGIFAAGSGAVHVTGSTFASNTATSEGGGIYIDNNGSVEISDSIIRDNHAHAGGGIENAGMRVIFTRLTIFGNKAVLDGGGVESQGSGDFTLLECSIFENAAENGGGIANAADGRLIVNRCVVYSNQARGGSSDDTGLGGGIYGLGDAAINIENTTISGNFAKVRGGGLYVDADAGTRITHCTITRNAAPIASGIGDEGTNFNFPILPSTAVIFRNTIIADNRLSPACNYALGSGGGNLEDGDSCFFRGERDRINATRVYLDALADNGGPTLSHALREGSIAIDGGVSPGPQTDQRGVTRPQSHRPDSGAVEYEGPFPPPDFLPPDTAFVSMQLDDEATRSFRFSGNDDTTPAEDLIFECRLLAFDPLEPPEPVDPNAPPEPEMLFVPCSNPWQIPDPEDGTFSLEIRAIDRAGNVDPTPARHDFTLEVDVNPPQTHLTSTPPNPSDGRSAVFTFAGSDSETPAHLLEFECRIDTNDPELWLECTNPAVFGGLTTGQHTVEIRALDLNENIDPTPARYTWTVGAPSDCNGANVTLTADMDGWIDQVTPFENLALIPELTVRSADLGGNARALVRFPLLDDSPGCVLESATLRLYSSSSTPGRILLAIPIAGAWAENQVTWINQPSTFGSPAVAASGDGYREWNVTSHVAGMLAGTAPNNGWLIRDSVEDDPEGADQSFLSREMPQDPPPVTLPQLVLRYAQTGPPPVPNPRPAPTPATVFCGQVITESTLVMNDLLDCMGEGLVIGAPDIVLDLNGHTIMSGLPIVAGEEEGLLAGIRNAGHDNVHIRNGTVKNFGYGVRVLGGATFNVIEDMVFNGNILAGVELFDADDGRNGNTIRDNYFTRNGEYSVGLVSGSENSVVTGNTFEGNGGPCVLIQDSSGHRIESNFMSGLSLDPLIGSDAGVYLESGSDNDITGNTVLDTGDAGIILTAGSHRNRIVGNLISRTSDGGVEVQDSDGNHVIDNVAHQTGGAGVVLGNAHGGSVVGNDVRFNPGGIEVGGGSSGFLIEDNDVSFSQQDGIVLEGGLGNQIVGNTAFMTGGTGIVVEAEAFDALGLPVPGNLIQGNTATQNRGDGISVSAGGHTVASNTARNNDGFGISAGEFVIDGGGNVASGNAEPEQCVGVICGATGSVPVEPLDFTPPETIISTAPANPSDFLSVRFTFTGTDNVAPPSALRFECRLDPLPDPPVVPEEPDLPDPGDPPDPPEPVDPTDPESWTECQSPMVFSFLEIGTHTFQVRAIDPADNTDFTHESYTWTAANLSSTPATDSLPPQTTITEGPSGVTIGDTVTFSFRGSDNDTPGANLEFECRLDGSSPTDFVPCTSPVTYAGLGLGPHSFDVRAVDAAGHFDPTPAMRTWTIEPATDPHADDATPPVTTIVTGPHVSTVVTSAEIVFTADEPGSTFECALDGAAFAPCASPVALSGLGIGSHVYRVRATDPAGNVDPTPAEHAWTIGIPPVPTVVACGQVLTQNTLVMNSLFDCLGDGLVIGANGITVDLNENVIDGTNLGAGIRNDGFDAVTIRNGSVQEFELGVLLNPGTEQNIVESMLVNLNELGGIQLSNADRNTIRNNRATGNGIAGIALLNGTQGALVIGNSLGSNPGEGIRIVGSSDNRFQDNAVVGSSENGFLLEGSGHNTIIDNTVTTNSGASIALTLQSNGNTVRSNDLTDSESGVHILDSNGNEVIGNIAIWTGNAGVVLENAHHNIVRGNDVRFNSGGIDLMRSTSNRVESNIASETSGTGISLEDSSLSNEIVLNTTNFNGTGIYIGDLAPPGSGNLIDRNTASHNESAGIHVGNIGHIIMGNTANDNGGWGIYAALGTTAGVNVDGGGNRAIDNTGGGVDPITLLPLQCYNVVCDGGPALVTDLMAPDTTITQAPDAQTNFTSATFSFTGSDNQTQVRFECRIDAASFAPCTSPATLTGLSLGLHTFEVRATDFSGNVDPTPASHTWTIEPLPVGIPPVTTIDSGPDPTTVSTSATFTFSANEPGAVFECSLDGEPFAPCSSPATYTGLGVGSHVLEVRAVDIEGLVDSTPASYAWTVGPPAVPTTVTCGQVLTRSTLVMNDLLDCLGDGLIIGADGITVDLNGHTIDGTGLGSGILNNGFDSVTITNGIVQEFDFGVQLAAGSMNAIVADMTLNLDQEAGIQLADADSADIRDNLISGCELGIALGEGTQNARIRNNVLSGNPGEGVYLLSASGNRIESNLITASSGAGVLLEGSSGNTVERNTLSANSGGGITLGATELPSNNNRVERNTLTGNSEGIEVVESSENRIIENTLELNAGGITLDGATDTLIRANHLQGNSGGIELSESSDNRLEANNASGNNGSGIEVSGLSLRNVLLLNTASANNGDGISVSDSVQPADGNRIERNTASNNGGDGIFAAGGHRFIANLATFNDGWGIFAEPGAIDGGGNLAAANMEPQQCSGIVCGDGGIAPLGAPDTMIVDRPQNPSNSRNAIFTFTGADDTTAPFDLGFECRLDTTDDLAWVECDNPQFYAALGPGAHRFEVRAVDLSGQVDATPAVYNWTYDPLPPGVPPNTLINMAPPASTPLLEGFFTFSATEPDVTFECSLDGSPFEPCNFDTEFPVSSGAYEFQFEEFQVGPHIFQVRATDFEGNADPTPATHNWIVRGILATVTAGPAFEPGEGIGEPASGGETDITTATFEFEANVADATFLCSLDLGPFVPCSSPATYTNLAIGEHTLRIIAEDPEGELVQVEPTEYEWSVILPPDVASPNTTITSAPANNSSATLFAFMGTDDITQALALTFECRLDSTDPLEWFSCISPFNILEEFPEFAPGLHTFEVRAIDDADPDGNVDPTPASHTWTSVADTTPPATFILSGPVASTIETEAEFVFIGSDNATPELLLAFECSLDGAPFEPCDSPEVVQSLDPGAHTFRVRALDLALNPDPTPATYGWTVIGAPETTILLGPALLSNERTATFTFTSDQPGSTFECSLDGGAFDPCASPVTYSSLPDGEHSFEVQATSSLGLVDETPALYEWAIVAPPDTAAPETSIVSGPSLVSNATMATFTFVASETPVTFECSLDGMPFGECISPHVIENLAEGPHTFGVWAIDAAGNADPTPDLHAWTVDLPPVVTVLSGPFEVTESTSATLEFLGNEPTLTFECWLDGVTSPCTSPVTYTGLSLGAHVFAVRATSPASGLGLFSGDHEWEVVAPAPPQTTLTEGPAAITPFNIATFAFTGLDNATLPEDLGFECALDGSDFAPCTSPAEYTLLPGGEHTFQVRAADSGNLKDPTPASYTWLIDSTLVPTAVTCGQVITGNVLLTNDISGCPGDGLIIGAAGIIVDLNGHTISGTGTGTGIRNDGFASVTITNSATTIENFQFGVVLGAGTYANVVSNIRIAQSEVGILLWDADNGKVGNLIENNVFVANGEGIVLGSGTQNAVLLGNTVEVSTGNGITLEASAGNRLESNVITLSGGAGIAIGEGSIANTLVTNTVSSSALHGIVVAVEAGPAFGNIIEGNTATQNVGDGIHVSAAAHIIGGNVANQNGGAGIIASEGNVDGGGNLASFNGSSWQCTGVTCGSPAPPPPAAPETTIVSGPPSTTTDTTATFALGSNMDDSTFLCSLDGAAFLPCSNPATYTGLARTAHTLDVKAVNSAGIPDPTPATHFWTIVAPLPPVTVTANADAWLDHNSSTTNKGSDSILKVQSKGPKDNFRSLVRFGLPAVPAGHEVKSATLSLYCPSWKNGRTLQAYRVNGNWSENQVTWANQPPVAGTAATTTSGQGWRQWTVTSQVKEMYSAGNYGFLIRDAAEGNSSGYEQQFHGREKGEQPPILVITFGPVGG